MSLQHHLMNIRLQTYHFDELRMDIDTSVPNTEKMMVVCNTFHGHALPSMGTYMVRLQQSPFVLAMPLVSTLDGRIFKGWAGNSRLVAGPCDKGSVILSWSLDKIVIFSTYDTRSSTVNVFLPCGDTMYYNVSATATATCNYHAFKLNRLKFYINYLKLNMTEKKIPCRHVCIFRINKHLCFTSIPHHIVGVKTQ